MTTTAPVAYRLHIDAAGKLRGNAWIVHNAHYRWPAVNGQGGLTPPMNGAVLHTNVGALPGTVSLFNEANGQASAHFEVGGPWSGTERNSEAQIWQFGPVNGWMAWHVENGNNDWFGVEVEDGGSPANPMTDAQLTAVAQIVEALSAQGGGWGFPLQVTDSTTGQGLAAHYLGGAAWGLHSCPDPSPGGQGPRSHQRHEIIRRAKILREHGQYPAPSPAPTVVPWTADGTTTMAELAVAHDVPVSTIVRLTAEHGGEFAPDAAHWLTEVLAPDIAPAGTVLYVPAPAA